jgi:glutamate dehydrogenase/leucine dehydrogenase
MDEVFRLADDLGPEKILCIHDPATNLKAVAVVDNVAIGPAIGGVRMAPDVSIGECFRLARAMTFKNAAAGLPHGGGKSVIFADPRMPAAEKERLVRAFARAIRDLVDYIPGPDMGTDESCMAWVRDTIGRAAGLPRAVGGIPLDEIGATGYGLAVAVEAAKDFCGLSLDGATVAVQGFGAVGRHAARFLAAKGARPIAASDSAATVVDENGLDIATLADHKRRSGGVAGFPGARTVGRDAIIDVPCDIWIPAARPDVLKADNVGRLKARLVAEGANIPATLEAERLLHERGILVLPDFIANAGGVICAAVEYHGGTEGTVFPAIAEKIGPNMRTVLEAARAANLPPRQAALDLARARVKAAMTYRRTW